MTFFANRSIGYQYSLIETFETRTPRLKPGGSCYEWRKEKDGQFVRLLKVFDYELFLAASAAPTIPASFRNCAGIIGVSIFNKGIYFSDSLLMPPPTMKRSGQKSFSMAVRYLFKRLAYFFQERLSRLRAASHALYSASCLFISR